MAGLNYSPYGISFFFENYEKSNKFLKSTEVGPKITVDGRSQILAVSALNKGPLP